MNKNLNGQFALRDGHRQGRILILLIVCILFPVFLLSSCKYSKATEEKALHKEELWTCSMHPEIIRDKPGICPICGMDLVKKDEGAGTIHDIQIDDLLQPTDLFVVSSIPVITAGKRAESIEVDALGTVAYDTRLVNTISARISGRIEKLYIHYRYQHILKGQRIMDIYSPEMLTTEQELLFLIQNDPDNSSLINASKQKLLLQGMSEKQLQQIISSRKPSFTIAVYSPYSGHVHEAGNKMPDNTTGNQKMDVSSTMEELSVKEGMYIEKGQNIFQLFDVTRSWVLLNIFPEYLGLIKNGDAVSVIPETAPSKIFKAKIDFIEPVFRKENKTLIARVYFNNSRLQIPIGSQVRATIFVSSKETNWLDKDAVLSLGLDKIVFIKTSSGFKAHKVETGLAYKGAIQILSGLNPADSVAVNAQFLTDSESFIKVDHQP